MRIALAQVNPLVGDVTGNVELIRRTAGEAAQGGADLVVFPEMVITGYPPLDLLERPELSARSLDALEQLAPLTRDGPALIVGHPAPNPASRGKPFVNAATLLASGSIRESYAKRLLPSYDVFDEDRWFEPGPAPGIMSLHGWDLGVAVCEDVWSESDMLRFRVYEVDPVAELASRSVRMVINPSASPYERGKPAYRESMLADLARRHRLPVLCVNQVGGNDSLIFDGCSLAVDAAGRTVARAPLCEDHLLMVDVRQDGSMTGTCASWPEDPMQELWSALKTGLTDYVRKCGFEQAALGLSGGIDSALVACLAADALGPENVTALSMPSRFSSAGSVDDAAALADNLGIRLHRISIEQIYETYLKALRPVFEDRPFDLAEENLQARARGTLLMGVSNKLGSLVLATGNKSELAVGYSTLYGDMVGALAPIGDVLKTDVYALARHVNRNSEVIPEDIIRKPPSAELRPDQTDQDSLPPYDLLDRVLRAYLEEDLPEERIAHQTGDAETVHAILSMVRRAEYKRIQAPLVLKVSSRAFGTGRRYPVAQGFGR